MTEQPTDRSVGSSAERVPLEWAKQPPVDIARAELVDLHKLLDEYRFQVKLNSDRTQSYLTLNTAILTVAAGLIRFGDPSARPLVVAICIVGIFVAVIARKAVEQGHHYYRSVVYKKTLVENLLGRHFQVAGFGNENATLALETTLGMAEQRKILQDPKSYSSGPITGKITGGLLLVFSLFILVDTVVAGFLLVLLALELGR